MHLLVIAMGFVDLNAALLLVAAAFGVKAPVAVLIVIPACLLAKALISIKDIGAAFDLLAIILIGLNFFVHVPSWILFIGAALIGFKGLRSFE